MTKLERLREQMKAQGVDAFICLDELNQKYLCEFAYTDGYLAITAEEAYLVTDFRYTEDAAIKANPAFTVLAPENRTEWLRELLVRSGAKTVGMEGKSVPYAVFRGYEERHPEVHFVDIGDTVELLRQLKTPEEIALMQKAQDIADAAFTHILSYINPDRTEIDVALELEFFMRAHGAECVSFETIAVSGTASSQPHGVPRPVKLEKGFLTMDFGARVKGYCSDMTRTVVIGKADDDMRRLYNTVLEAQLASLAACAEGAGCKQLDTIARDIIDNAGYKGAFGHSLGHGVGMYIHENPRLSQGAAEDSVLQRGHVVTFEPGIYLPGKYGCRIEDMVAITPDGRVHNFTHSDKSLIEL